MILDIFFLIGSRVVGLGDLPMLINNLLLLETSKGAKFGRIHLHNLLFFPSEKVPTKGSLGVAHGLWAALCSPS